MLVAHCGADHLLFGTMPELVYQTNAFLEYVLVNQTEFVHSASFEILPVSFDEGILGMVVVVLPVLCVLQVLAQRLQHGCLHSTFVEDDARQWSGELNEAPSDMYTDEQRRRDRAEEARIKGRASRSISMSHV